MVSVGNNIFFDASARRLNMVVPPDHASSDMETLLSVQNKPKTPILQSDLTEVPLVVNISVTV